MSNETKRDVFEEFADECAGLNDEIYNQYMQRYDTALPDDLPVIPENVAYVIEQAKKGDYKLGWVFHATYLGLWRVSVGNWIRTHSDVFASAWLDGYVVEVEK